MRVHSSANEVEQITGGRWDVPVAVLGSSNSSRQQELMGEYVLVGALLREAIREYQKFAGQESRRGARLFREVHQWFLAEDREWDFSFINVCQILDLEPTYIRAGLKMWRERNVKQSTGMTKCELAKSRQRQALSPVGFAPNAPVSS